MRLSDAILLGSTLIKARTGTAGEYGGPGCAQGMAIVATGDSHNRAASFLIRWRWTMNTVVGIPCGCVFVGRETVDVIIAHLFDKHTAPYRVAKGKRSWTIEQLADWVRSVEPPENLEQTEVNACEVIQVNG